MTTTVWGMGSRTKQTMRVAVLLFWVCAVSAVQDESVLTLRHGVKMPAVGYGTAGRMNQHNIALALDAGFQLLDSAQAPEVLDTASLTLIPLTLLFLFSRCFSLTRCFLSCCFLSLCSGTMRRPQPTRLVDTLKYL